MDPLQQAEALILLKAARLRLYAMVEAGRKDCLAVLNRVEGFLDALEMEKPTQMEWDIQVMAKFILTYRHMADPYDELEAHQIAAIAARTYYKEPHDDKG